MSFIFIITILLIFISLERSCVYYWKGYGIKCWISRAVTLTLILSATFVCEPCINVHPLDIHQKTKKVTGGSGIKLWRSKLGSKKGRSQDLKFESHRRKKAAKTPVCSLSQVMRETQK